MSSFYSILDGFTKNNFSPKLKEWEAILDRHQESVTEDDVWDYAKGCDKFPQLEDVYHSLALSRLESIFIDLVDCEWDDIDFFIYVNCYDTHFCVNGESIDKEDDFYRMVKKVRKQLRRLKH
ncbi:hypothetical protein FW755_09495 [Lonepinella koalarum]|uniref:hypothetical protein n=1 Tax=Lonepinella koalarum TaxID=53417 RepID=UPI0011E4B329|nr:hypothetical protein [Lonepinella koalarum]TYG35309.1 hypothetical protein FW755_09495 [Lonepinella koalarum]